MVKPETNVGIKVLSSRFSLIYYVLNFQMPGYMSQDMQSSIFWEHSVSMYPHQQCHVGCGGPPQCKLTQKPGEEG